MICLAQRHIIKNPPSVTSAERDRSLSQCQTSRACPEQLGAEHGASNCVTAENGTQSRYILKKKIRTISEQLTWLIESPLIAPTCHPRFKLRSVQNDLLFALNNLKEHFLSSNTLPPAAAATLWNSLVTYVTEEFHAQLLANIMVTMLVKTDDPIVLKFIDQVVQHFEAIGLLSPHILGCAIIAFKYQNELSPEQETFVLRCYDHLADAADNLHPVIRSDILSTIANTSRWRSVITQCSAGFTSSLSFAASLVLDRALQLGSYDVVQEVLLLGRETPLNCKHIALAQDQAWNILIHKAMVQVPTEQYNQILQTLSACNRSIPMATASSMATAWNSRASAPRSGPIAFVSRINKRGQCEACGDKLEEEVITVDQMELLKSHFYKDSIIRQGVYHLCDPKALRNFLDYVDTNGPYDLVIDGLNALHLRGFSEARHRVYDTLIEIIDEFSRTRSSSKRVLLVARTHAYKSIPNSLRTLANFYLVSNDASDDVFTLYAALSSGPQCFVISSDKFHNHCKDLNSEMFYFFRRWQRLRQITRPETGLVRRYKIPLQTTVTAQKNKTSWHVPISQEDLERHTPRHAFRQPWLCLPTT